MSDSTTRQFELDVRLLDEHRTWLSAFDPQHNRNWEKLLAADAESAACEAAVRRHLEANGSTVVPNESLTGSSQSPDFRCHYETKSFYVEVTHLSIEKVTDVTSLDPIPADGAQHYRPLNNAIFHAAKNKAPQCADLEHPTVVAVGTFHYQASAICTGDHHVEMLLTGQSLIAWNIDTRTGSGDGEPYEITRLRSAIFVRPDDEKGVDHARSSVSAILFCGFGCEPLEVRGILHPSPARVFDPKLLPGVRFCRLRDGYESGSLSTEWV